MTSFKIVSYNMHGFYNGIDFVNEILDKVDCICVQEHWQREQSLSVFNYIDDKFSSISYSSMYVDDLHARGRPYGGLAILYRSNKIKLIEKFNMCMNKRVCTALFDVLGTQMLLFNVYFPCKGDVDYNSEIDIICGYVTSIIDSFKSPDMNVIIAGDFNDDLSVSEFKGLNCWKNIMNIHNLIPCSSIYKGKINYTFRNDTRDVSSFIDNIVFDKKLLNNLNYVDIIDDVTNFSDHLAITCHFHMNTAYNEQTKNKNYSSNMLRKYFWTDFAKDKYYADTGLALQLTLAKYSIIKSLSVNDLNNLYEEIVNVLRNCSDPYLHNWHKSSKFKWSK